MRLNGLQSDEFKCLLELFIFFKINGATFPSLIYSYREIGINQIMINVFIYRFFCMKILSLGHTSKGFLCSYLIILVFG